ncbi:formate dehydrogenase subunit alpha [Halogeometricum pallidum JCM 14848]|uniref:Formate dehydrogenase subunit alpha n=1 Tax=Halogeometricum pallidum JCM 14848 TaxID=1227487 RepID=M0D1E7_HALPD|nr:molybdopterin-dependent oxidoreductase [Halogeometricum pallidum]ELZ28492.1 formate dehydrogenase subunit alpha [Halogeometricum pallidum JCM 14848]
MSRQRASEPKSESDPESEADTPSDADETTRRYAPVDTVCPSCSVGCGLRYSDRTGGAVGREGAPVNPEGRLCPKGIEAFDGLDEDRLTTPLVREDGTLVPASWEEALDRVERELGGLVDAHGPDSLAFLGAPRCTNEENYLFGKLARTLGTNNVDNRARICHRSAVTATTRRFGCGAMTNTLEDISEADVFLVVGSNPAAQQPIAFDSYVRPAVNDGATLVHVDPRANRTTRAADVHLAARPGTDALLVRLLLAELLELDAVDREFVEERTTGFEAFADSFEEFDVDAGVERTGVDAEKIRRVARAVGDADGTAVIVGTGAEAPDHRGTATVDALLNLLLLTGNVGRRGAGMNVLRGLNNEQGANDVGMRPTTLPGFDPVDDPEARERVAAEWGVDPPTDPGLSELEAVRAFGDDVRGAYVLGENPAVTRMETQFVARKFESLDFLLVQDIAPSETVEHADVVLPGSAWAEKDGTVTNLDRQVQRMRAAASPPDSARRDLDIVRELGRRLTGTAFAPETPEGVFEEITRVNPLYAGMSYAGLESGSQRWPFPEGATEGVGVLHRDRFMNGEKRAPLLPVDATDDTEEDADDADDSSPGLVVLTRKQVNEGGSGADDGDAPELLVHPDDAASRGIRNGDRVVLDGAEAVEAVASLSPEVREGAVFLDAEWADRLLAGRDSRTVGVRAADSTSDSDAESKPKSASD